MGKIRFAIIGCGRIAYRHIEAIEQNPSAELVALCDLNLARAEERRGNRSVKVYRDYREMLSREEIDVVSLMTPSGMHGEHAIDIVKNFKKHVVVEKPVVLNIQDGETLKRLARKNKVRVFAVQPL
jgi:predicted dehydrogenase